MWCRQSTAIATVLRVPDLPVPESPPEQAALRDLLERLLAQHEGVATYRHGDTFWESDSGGRTVYGWGTQVTAIQSDRRFEVWFDGLDLDIAVWTEKTGWRRRDRSLWFEWRDLSDMTAVLASVEERLRALLAEFA